MANERKQSARSFSGSSITRKYAAGYFLIMVIAVMLFVVSFFSGRTISNQYQHAVDDLLDLNNLFIDVENTNRALNDYYLYLRPLSSENYSKESAMTRQNLDRILDTMDASFSREVMDLCCIVDSYLKESDQLISAISDFQSAGSSGDRASVVVAYTQTQKLVSFINRSFQEVYASKLETTQQMQYHIEQVLVNLNVVQISMLALAMGVSVFFYQRVVRGMSRSVNQLIAFASGITQDLACQEHVHIDTGDELSVFADAFNEMMDTIHAQMAQIEMDSRMREQLQEAEMENLRISSALQSSQLRLLQSRINPHFLFNTLNMITQMAHMEDAEETAHLMEATADFLRYNLGKVTKSVTLADEIENTKNYVYIQRCRFGDRIGFEFQVDETCTGQEIPCMILQPLVENAVSHGVGSMIGGGLVTVSLSQREEHVCLEVMDNGVGIDPQLQKKIKDSFDTERDDDSHMGLHNVYQRLRLFFGAGLRFELESEPGRTVVRMLLPK